MPHVRKALEAVICWSDTSRDFMPMGSEQPKAFEYTEIEGPRGERERNDKKERERETKTG